MSPSGEVIGFVGVGNQGGPMAARVVAAGHPLVVWARRPEALGALLSAGAEQATDLADLGARATMIEVCVVDDAALREVVTGPGGLLGSMRPGGSIAVHSTVHPDTVKELAVEAASAGVSVLDAPVSGGHDAAAEGRLLVLAGGAAADIARWRPVLEAFASTVVHLGPLGAGQLAKLVNNALMAAQFRLADDAHELAAGLGLDPGALLEAMAHGSGASFSLDVHRRSGGRAGMAGRGARLLHKDVSILARVLDADGVDGRWLLPVAAALFEIAPPAAQPGEA